MNEALTFQKISSEIGRNLEGMSRIKLLLTWIAVNSLDRKFPRNIHQINQLLKKIESQMMVKANK